MRSRVLWRWWAFVLASLNGGGLFKGRSGAFVDASKVAMNDTAKYPACLADEDCLDVHFLADHACFQYFCYPHKKEALSAEQAKAMPLPLCRNSAGCPAGHECFRTRDVRNVHSGVCLAPGVSDGCSNHEECAGEKGGKCCNGFCCGEDYFDGLKALPCTRDEGCQVRIFDGFFLVC